MYKQLYSFMAYDISPAKPFRFFKVVLSDINLHSKLMIPKRFVTLYGNTLSEYVSLKTPTGSVWSINLERHSGDQILLQKGWPEFAKFNSICFGHMLVFEYQGNSQFKVHIYDPNALEIDYQGTNFANPKAFDSNRVKRRISDIYIATSSPTARLCKKARASFECIEKTSDIGPQLQQQKVSVKHLSASKEEKDAVAAANAFTSQNPFFIHVMRKSNVDGKHPNLYITRAFEEAYNRWKSNDKVILHVAERTWPVYCNLHLDSYECRLKRQGNKRLQMVKSKAGEASVPALEDAFKSKNPFFKVRLSTSYAQGRYMRLNEMDVSTSSDTTRPPKKTKPNVATKDVSHNGVCLMPKSASGDGESAIDKEANYKGRALASAQTFRSNNPFFVVSMKPSHVDGRGNGMVVDKVPKEIYINWKNNDQVNLKVDGRSWLVECDMKRKNMCRLRGGWDKFVKENSLSVDDACVFELIDAFKKLFHVFIYRARNETSCAKGDGESEIDEKVNCKGRALASAQTFRSNFPFFVVAMTRSNVEGKGHGMNVPMAFENSFKNWKTNDQVNLQVEGKSWLVKCDRKQDRCRLSHGWDTFAQEKSLIVDDVCVFELIDAHKKLFRVFIYRATKEGTGNYRLPVLSSANAFKSKNPFCTVKMRPSYVHGRSVFLLLLLLRIGDC